MVATRNGDKKNDTEFVEEWHNRTVNCMRDALDMELKKANFLQKRLWPKYYEYLVEDIIEDIEGDRILLLILDAKDKANEEHLTGILSRIDFTKHHPQFAGHVLDAIKQVTK
jgi:hypothetical protein